MTPIPATPGAQVDYQSSKIECWAQNEVGDIPVYYKVTEHFDCYGFITTTDKLSANGLLVYVLSLFLLLDELL